MKLSPWKKFRYRLEWLAFVALQKGIPLLSRRACVSVAEALGFLAYKLDRRGREVALANLELAFGADYNAAERQKIARQSYQNFARTFLDLFWSSRLTPENWRDYIETDEVTEAFLRTRNSEKPPGGVIMCIHWGNFEWASLAFGFLGCPTTIVTENFKNPRLTAFFREGRQTSGHTIIGQENAMIRLLKIVKRRGMAGMLTDLNVRPEQAAVAIDAFGHKMSVTCLQSILARRGGAQLLPLEGEPLPNGRVHVTMYQPVEIPPDATAQQIAQKCWDLFEPSIRRRPELWMWAYKHWRYRPTGAPREDYPFYANEYYLFDNMVADQQRQNAP